MTIETTTPILFFDTETTGILKDDKNQISSNGDLIQLAYRKLDGDTKTDKNIFVYTDTKIEIGAMATHGIYPDLLQEKTGGKGLEDSERAELNPEFTNNIIVAHNIDFDKDVLERSGIAYGEKMIDTLKVAKVLWSEGVLLNSQGEAPEYVNLQYLRYFFELYQITDADGNAEVTTAHDAFGDVIVLENVFYSLFEIIKTKLECSDEEVLEAMMRMTAKEYILIKTMRVGKYRGQSFEEVANIDKGYLEWMIKADFTEDIKYTCKVWLGQEEDEKFFS
ncbi:3'-5' exonuclease [Candidatus Gracilibacteria bacterium]|nr:3'-5' exonuclease [Candidatus Gracilibacteria bacterium]